VDVPACGSYYPKSYDTFSTHFSDFHRFSAPAFLLFINTDDTKTQPGFGAPLEGGGLLIHPDLFVQTDLRLFC